MLSTLRALWQADGAFPSGSFAFSYGIEGVLALRQGIDTDEFASLLTAVLRHRWATYDRIALLRSFRADGDLAAIAVVDREVEASTLVQPLRDCSRRNGASFLASHARLGTVLAGELRDAVRAGELLGHIPVMQGAVWSAIELDEKLAQLTSGYSVASGLVTAAVRLGAIGALEAERVLGACLPLIEQLSADPVQAVFPDGTKLVTVHEPIRPAPGAAADPEHPGLVEALAGGIELNEGRRSTKLVAVNTGDRPIQIGSHFHFFEVNKALEFDRAAAFNMRLDIPARTA